MTASTENTENRNSNALIEEIQNTPTTAEWERYRAAPESDYEQYGLEVTLPHGCGISGRLLYDNKNGGCNGFIDMMHVGTDEQKKEGITLTGAGIGTRLLQSFTVEVKKFGAQYIMGHITSESMLRTEAKVFGTRNLKFLSHITKEPIQGMTFEKALNEGNFNYDVVVDLTVIDTSEWEAPLPKEKS